MLDKNPKLTFDIAAKRSLKSTEIVFNSQDINSAKLSFKITKDNGDDADLSGATGKIAIKTSDGSLFVDDVEILVNKLGTMEYILTQD